MKIKLWPDLVEWPLEATVGGDVITINGQAFDFSPLKDGQRLPGLAIDSEYFIGSEFVERRGGVIHVTLRFPVAWESPEEIRNPPAPIIIDAKEGVVNFPDASPDTRDELEITPEPRVEEEVQAND